MTTGKSTTGECAACRRVIGLWQAAFTSECAHTFHLRCVSGAAACPVCAARWADAPATAPAPAPSTPFAFPSSTTTTTETNTISSASAASSPRTPFGQTPLSIAHNSSSSSSFTFASPSPCAVCCCSSFSSRVPFGQPPPMCDAMRAGQATVTSECSHTFHLRCIASVYSARSVCPVCGARWRDAVCLAPAPLEAATTTSKDDGGGVVVLTAHCEGPAVARDTARDSFAVLVRAKAPAAAALDLVAVLDVGGSMAGERMALLKQAMGFVVDRLGRRDRLCIVAFSSEARRVLRLARMSDAGKAAAKAVIESLVAEGGSDIGGGLRVAAEVLDGRRRHRNAVAGVILFSDGQDNQTSCHGSRYSDLVPSSLRPAFGSRCTTPVHVFVLGGACHGAGAMRAVAEVTVGTLSFIEKEAAPAAVLQDSLARCIGGLVAVAAQEVRVAVECLHPGVHVRGLKSGAGGRRCYLSAVGTDGRAASVDVGEERRFLLFLAVPVAAATGDGTKGGGDDGGSVIRLTKVSCSYKDAATGRSVHVSCDDDVAVRRPVVVPSLRVTATDMDMESRSCVEVARERFRVEAAEDMEVARGVADRGEHARAALILDRRLEVSTAAGVAGDHKCAELVAELRELRARVADRQLYTAPPFGSTVPAFGTPAPGSTSGATTMGGLSFGGSTAAVEAAAESTPSFMIRWSSHFS